VSQTGAQQLLPELLLARSVDDSYGCASGEVDLGLRVRRRREALSPRTARQLAGRRVDSSGVSYKLQPDAAAATAARLMVLRQRLIMTGVRRPCNLNG